LHTGQLPAGSFSISGPLLKLYQEDPHKKTGGIFAAGLEHAIVVHASSTEIPA
jgi:hypothetical protein